MPNANVLERKPRPQGHLINILKATKAHHPNFTLLLGAGASVSSGVKAACSMIEDWRKCYCDCYRNGEPADEFLKKQTWYKTAEEYSVLFELLYDQPSQRREYIESQIESASPSWGYIYLVNLIRSRVFNTVFTTNFDDLLNEACYSFSQDVRPIVCAHDSSIKSVRITSRRPKIIKLHGDFLFDNIKNTTRELESLEDNMRDKFKQYAPEAGLIVVGHGGNDRSVMDTINSLLRSDHNFPHGVYWCVRPDADVSQKVVNLSRFPRFALVEIHGYDEFFAELHEELGVSLPPSMANPYQALSGRLNALLNKVKVDLGQKVHPVMDRDIKNLAAIIRQQSGQNANAPEEKKQGLISVPYQFLAEVAMHEKDPPAAMKYIIAQLREKPTIEAFTTAIQFLRQHWEPQFAEELFVLAKKSPEMFAKQPMPLLDFALPFIAQGKYERADEVLDWAISLHSDRGKVHPYFHINKGQIKRHQKIPFTAEERIYFTTLKESISAPLLVRWGAAILLEDFNTAADILNLHSDKQLGTPRSEIEEWPIYKLISKEFVDGTEIKPARLDEEEPPSADAISEQ
jgi:NAD-dependent SIR2 family protein deacetylase